MSPFITDEKSGNAFQPETWPQPVSLYLITSTDDKAKLVNNQNANIAASKEISREVELLAHLMELECGCKDKVPRSLLERRSP